MIARAPAVSSLDAVAQGEGIVEGRRQLRCGPRLHQVGGLAAAAPLRAQHLADRRYPRRETARPAGAPRHGPCSVRLRWVAQSSSRKPGGSPAPPVVAAWRISATWPPARSAAHRRRIVPRPAAPRGQQAGTQQGQRAVRIANSRVRGVPPLAILVAISVQSGITTASRSTYGTCSTDADCAPRTRASMSSTARLAAASLSASRARITTLVLGPRFASKNG